MPSLGGFPSEYFHDVWYGKLERSCGYPMVKKLSLFVLTERTNVTDRQTPHDDIGRVCIASRGKNEETKPSNGQVAGVQQA